MSSDASYLDRIVASALPCILIEGRDARGFAQAQFSGDIDGVAPGGWQWNAWLDARGRVLALMQLAAVDDDRLLAIPRGGDPERMLATLQRYVLRRDVVLSARSFSACWGEPLATGRFEHGAGVPALGLGGRSLRLEPVAERPVDPDAANAWRLEEVRSGWPVLPSAGPTFLPPALGLERLGAVSFDKGCYPGQEIAARLHYRGGHKLRLHHVCGPAPLPASGPVQAEPAPATVLAIATGPGGIAALIVGPARINSRISTLNHMYQVESTFDV